jgi:hypothetical protein
MKPDIKAARKAIAACRERGDGVLDLGGLGVDDAALKELLPEIIKLPPLKALNLGRAGEVDSQSIDLTRHEEKPKKNALHSLPAELIEAQGQLVFLNLRHNQLAALPESIGGLAQLQGLWLDGNQLAALPESIGALAQLQTLYLDGNQLAALPESIGGLAQLQWLWLASNQLAALPEAIGGLAQLQGLFLDGSSLSLPLSEPRASRCMRRKLCWSAIPLRGRPRCGVGWNMMSFASLASPLGAGRSGSVKSRSERRKAGSTSGISAGKIATARPSSRCSRRERFISWCARDASTSKNRARNGCG